MVKCEMCGKISGNQSICFVCRRKQRMKELDVDFLLPTSVPFKIRKNLAPRPPLPKFVNRAILIQEQSFFLWGNAGAGKSHEAGAVMFHSKLSALESNLQMTFGWHNVPHLLFQLRQVYNKTSEEQESTIVYNLTNVDWLCLDDLGAEKVSDWSKSILYLIINSRYENELPTVITSNLSLDDLSSWFGDDRLSSRISGMCTAIEFSGEDKRQK